jgi:hypothetical protein
MAIHLVSLVRPLDKEFEKQVLAGCFAPASTCFSKDFPSPIGFLANGGGERGGGLSNYIRLLSLIILDESNRISLPIHNQACSFVRKIFTYENSPSPTISRYRHPHIPPLRPSAASSCLPHLASVIHPHLERATILHFSPARLGRPHRHQPHHLSPPPKPSPTKAPPPLAFPRWSYGPRVIGRCVLSVVQKYLFLVVFY